MSTPYKKRAPDSPSRQLLWELNQLAISSQEHFYANLDRANEEQAESHKQALAAAARRHERVRQDAENESRRLQQQEEARQRRQEEERRVALENERRQVELDEQRSKAEQIRLEEAHKKELEKIRKEREEFEKQRETERRRKEYEDSRRLHEERDLEQKREESARAAEQRAQNDVRAAEAKSRDLAETKSKEAAATALEARNQPKPNGATLGSQSSRNQQWELEHSRYLQIHKQLKTLRQFMVNTAKERPQLKAELGNMRRDIKKSVGQLIEGRGSNKKPLANIIEILKKALTIPEPQVKATEYLVDPPPGASSDPNGPALILYLLNEFAKSVVSQWIDEAGVSPKRADAIGIVASHVFALDPFRWKGLSLIDILLAKLHVVAPALFGIYGSENTVQGKERIGWWRQDGRSEGPFIPDQQHFVRMTGLAAGYASLSLRNYEKAKVENPYPERYYWEALAKITNVPPQSITQTHFVLLKGMIENYETKFIGFYGGAAVAALKETLIELPARCPTSVASKSLAGLKDVLERETKLFL